MHRNKPLVICDLDNTLYDWYGYFVPSIYSLIEVAADILRCKPGQVIDSLRVVHQRHHDSEHPFALLETQLVRDRFPGMSPSELFSKLNPAFHAFNKSRKANLKLFDDVIETLGAIRERGLRIVAHTDSKLYGAVDRINRLGLEPFLDRIYCRKETPSRHPTMDQSDEWLRHFNWRKVVRLPLTDVKPNARILRDICSTEKVTVAETIYVGDSLTRDVLMAKQAGSFAVWAKYSSRPSSEMYEKLVRISHWTADDIAREKTMRAQAETIKPDFICEEHFAEVLAAIDRSPQRDGASAFRRLA